jgi:hypothetical protein
MKFKPGNIIRNKNKKYTSLYFILQTNCKIPFYENYCYFVYDYQDHKVKHLITADCHFETI